MASSPSFARGRTAFPPLRPGARAVFAGRPAAGWIGLGSAIAKIAIRGAPPARPPVTGAWRRSNGKWLERGGAFLLTCFLRAGWLAGWLAGWPVALSDSLLRATDRPAAAAATRPSGAAQLFCLAGAEPVVFRLVSTHTAGPLAGPKARRTFALMHECWRLSFALARGSVSAGQRHLAAARSATPSALLPPGGVGHHLQRAANARRTRAKWLACF